MPYSISILFIISFLFVSVYAQDDAGTVVLTGSINEGGTITITLTDTDGLEGGQTSFTSFQIFEADLSGDPTGTVIVELLSEFPNVPVGGNSLSIELTLPDTQGIVDKNILAIVTYRDRVGNIYNGEAGQNPEGKSDVSQVGNVNDEGTISAITGTFTQGQTLTVGAIADGDGAIEDITYQWLADEQIIVGATENTYQLTQDEVGTTITVRAQYSDPFQTETVVSEPTTVVQDIEDAGVLTLTGASNSGESVLATLKDIDGLDSDGAVLTSIELFEANNSGNPTGAVLSSILDFSGVVIVNGNELSVRLDIPDTASLIGKDIIAVATYTDDFGTVYNGVSGNPSKRNSGVLEVTENVFSKIIDGELELREDLEEVVSVFRTITSRLAVASDSTDDFTVIIRAIEQIVDEDGASDPAIERAIETLLPDNAPTLTSVVESTVSDISALAFQQGLLATSAGLIGVNGPGYDDIILVDGHFYYSGSFNSGQRDKSSTVLGYDYDGYSVSLGYDQRHEDVFMGIVGTYNSTSVDNGQSEGTSEINTLAVSLYNNYQDESDFLNASLTFASSDIDTEREGISGKVTGETNAISYDLNILFGRVIKWGKKSKITPVVGLRYNLVSFDDIIEQGVGETRSLSNNYDSLYGSVGVILATDIIKSEKLIHELSCMVTYSYNILDVDRGFKSQFRAGESSLTSQDDITFQLDSIDQEKAEFNFGLSWRVYASKISFEFGANLRITDIASSSSFNFKVKHSY